MAVLSSRRAADPRFPLLCLLLLAASSTAEGGEFQPDRLNFGRVHVGARVQGSVRIFVDAKDSESKEAKVEPPSFVRVDNVTKGVQEYRKGKVRGYCDIAVMIDTAKDGEFSGLMVMTLGDRRVEVPVAASIRPRDDRRPRILVADTPFHKFSTPDARLFDPWLDLVTRDGLDVEYLAVRGGKAVFDGMDLSGFDGILLGEMGIVGLKAADLVAVRKVADGGGCVFVTANHFFMGSVAKANELLVPYGLEMKDTEATTVQPTEVEPPQVRLGPLTEGVKSLSFQRPSPSTTLDKDRTMVIVASPNDPDSHFVAMALAGDQGRVVSLGVSLWWSWVGQADNAILMSNLLPKRHRAR
jgi:hypothetical protein